MLKVRTVRRLMLLLIFLLGLAHLAGEYLVLERGHPRAGLIAQFYLDYEYNVPTYVSGVLWLFAAFLSAVVWGGWKQAKAADAWLWLLVAATCLGLSADEILQMHERLIEPLRDRYQTSGLLYQAWVLVYVPVLAVMALVFFRFLRSVPRWLIVRLAVAAAVFLTGAVGIETLGSLWYQDGQTDTWGYAISTLFEEEFEMFAVVLLCDALLRHIYWLQPLHFLDDARPDQT